MVQRTVPPEPPQRTVASEQEVSRTESVGDLHLAADNFAGAVESYGLALGELKADELPACFRLSLKLAQAEFHRGAYAAAEAAAARAREASRLLGDPRAGARVALRMAAILHETGAYRRSMRYARYAYAVLRDSDEHRAVGAIALTIGLDLNRLGRPQAAIEWFQTAAATFRRIDDSDGLVNALNNLGLVYKNLREWREAVRFLEQALGIDERKGLYARMRTHHQNLGLIRYRLGQWDMAEEHFRHSLRISREVRHAASEAQALLAMGMLARRRRQLERATDFDRQALELAENSGAVREALLAREFLAEIELDRDHGAGALQLLEPALEDAQLRAPQGDLVMELQIRMALALQLAGRPDDAQGFALKGMALAERLGDRVEQAVALRVLARLDAVRGHAAAMESRLRDAAQCFEQLGETYELASTLVHWGECLLLLPASVRLRLPLEPVADASRRGASLFRQLGVVPLAAEALLTLARLESEREHYDQALSLLEQAEQWLADSGDAATAERAEALRRENLYE